MTPPLPPTLVRLADRPLIGPDLLPGRDGDNINGPSVIAAPPWLDRPPARYFLYFAHHRGDHVRLALADDLAGPWRLHPGGALRLDDVPACTDHIASPDVHVDPHRRQVRMYFHGPPRDGGRQTSYVALSDDGLRFRARPAPLGPFYFRAFRHDGVWYALSKGGVVHRSDPDGLAPFEPGPAAFSPADSTDPGFNRPGSVRHVAVDRRDGHPHLLDVYHSRIGDAPERLLLSTIDLRPPWQTWRAAPAVEVLRPERPWEGVRLPITPSVAGAANGPEHALRDPCLFRDAGQTYLFYSVAGESGIAAARLYRDGAPEPGRERKPGRGRSARQPPQPQTP